MKAALLCCTLAVGLTGCFVFGERFGSGRAVSLRFPASADLAVSNPEIQQALEITDTVLLPQGLNRGALLPSPDANGMIAYYHYTPERPRSCTVFLSGDSLNIVFREHARHSSEDVKKMCGELAEKLRNHYDPKRVRVEG
jgi:hypothetical protein